MCENIVYRLIARKLCDRFIVGASSFLLVMVFSSLAANAAGCNYHPEQRMFEVQDGISKIYEGGRFYYYEIVPPCSGQSCGQSKPTSMKAFPRAVANERSTSQTLLGSYYTLIVARPSSSFLEKRSHYSSPSFDELLRPPV